MLPFSAATRNFISSLCAGTSFTFAVTISAVRLSCLANSPCDSSRSAVMLVELSGIPLVYANVGNAFPFFETQPWMALSHPTRNSVTIHLNCCEDGTNHRSARCLGIRTERLSGSSKSSLVGTSATSKEYRIDICNFGRIVHRLTFVNANALDEDFGDAAGCSHLSWPPWHL